MCLAITWTAVLFAVHFFDFRLLETDGASVINLSRVVVDEAPVWTGTNIHPPLTLGPLLTALGTLPILLTRDIHYFFYFMSLLQALSIVVFFFAAREIQKTGPFAPIATAIYANAVLILHTPMIPINTQFRPIFWTLYLYGLARAERRREPLFLVLVWAAVGLCMQTHFALILLIPATLAAIPPRNRKEWGYVATGAAIIAAMHVHLIPQVLRLLQIPGAVTPMSLASGASRTNVLKEYFSSMELWLQTPFERFGIVLPILGLLFMLVWRFQVLDRYRFIFRALIAYHVVFLPLFSYQDISWRVHAPRYYEDSIIFWSLAAAAFITLHLSPDVVPRFRRAAGVVAWIAVIASQWSMMYQDVADAASVRERLRYDMTATETDRRPFQTTLDPMNGFEYPRLNDVIKICRAAKKQSDRAWLFGSAVKGDFMAILVPDGELHYENNSGAIPVVYRYLYTPNPQGPQPGAIIHVLAWPERQDWWLEPADTEYTGLLEHFRLGGRIYALYRLNGQGVESPVRLVKDSDYFLSRLRATRGEDSALQ